MAKKPTDQQTRSWAIYVLRDAKFVGIVYDRPDADSAIKQAVVEDEFR